MRRLLVALSLLFCFVAIGASAPVHADTNVFKQACTAETKNSTICQSQSTRTENPLYGPTGIITKAVRIISIIVGIAAVIMIIVGGIQFILGEGDSGKINSARSTLIYALVGLIITLIAQGIVVFVLNRL